MILKGNKRFENVSIHHRCSANGFLFLLVCLSVATIKHSNQKPLRGGRTVFIQLMLPGHSLPPREVRAETEVQTIEGQCLLWSLAYSQLTSSTTRDHLPKNSTPHSGLDTPISDSIQESVPQIFHRPTQRRPFFN